MTEMNDVNDVSKKSRFQHNIDVNFGLRLYTVVILPVITGIPTRKRLGNLNVLLG